MGIDIIIEELANVGITIAICLMFIAVVRWIDGKIKKK